MTMSDDTEVSGVMTEIDRFSEDDAVARLLSVRSSGEKHDPKSDRDRHLSTEMISARWAGGPYGVSARRR